MRYLGVFNSSSDITSAVNSGSLKNPYIAVYDAGAEIDYNSIKKIYTFGGYEIAPGPIVYRNSQFEIDNEKWSGPGSGWQDNNWSLAFGLNEGSYWFSANDIDNFVVPERYNDFDLPTSAALESIFGTNRNGSTVGENQSVCFAYIQYSGSLNGRAEGGLLIFPDNETISTRANNDITIPNSLTVGTYSVQYRYNWLTKDKLDEFIDQGCIFIPKYVPYGSSSVSWLRTMGGVYSGTVSSDRRSFVMFGSDKSFSFSSSSSSGDPAHFMLFLVRPYIDPSI